MLSMTLHSHPIYFPIPIPSTVGVIKKSQKYRRAYKETVSKGRPHGPSSSISLSGVKTASEGKNDLKIGCDTYTYSNGSKYTGDWKNGKFHGKGHYTFGEGSFIGDIYDGQFRQGEFEGKGIYTWSDERKYDGTWKGSDFWNGAEYSKDKKEIARYSEGKRFKRKKWLKRKPAPVIRVEPTNWDPHWIYGKSKETIDEWKTEMAIQKQQVLK